MKAKSTKDLSGVGQFSDNARLVRIFTIVLVLFSIGLYYNTAFNYFSFDDGYISVNNPVQAKGLAAIPEIFTSSYTSLKGSSIGYRPITRLTFALEYQFTADSPYNPMISHIINTLLYALAIFLLYNVLRRLLRKFNPWFIFFIVLLFTAHPLHTEVVASLKNRDILLNFIFSFLAIKMFVNWADFKKTKYLIYGIISYFMALLSKETAIAHLAIFPIVLYYFTDMPLKKILIFTGGLIATATIAIGVPVLFMPSFTRVYRLFENPIAFEDNFLNVIASGFYSLGWYLKLLIVPFPLRYYYGYNMLPVVGFTNIWAILSFLAYAGMFIYAILNFKKKTFLSFVILYFLITISMYANIVMPVPGIVGDRFMFFPSLSFSMILVWLTFKVFGVDVKGDSIKPIKLYVFILLAALLVAPYSYYVHIRNTHWRSEYKLYNSDMGHLWNSAKANQLFAQAQLELVNVNLEKKVNTYKYTVGMIEVAEKHFNRAVEIDSSMYTSWQALGNIYSRIHGNQAKLRAQTFEGRNELEKAREERANEIKYFNMAHEYYREALIAYPDFDEAVFNIGNAYELQGIMDSAVIYYRKGIAIQGERVNTLSKLANALFLTQQFDEALKTNQRIIELNPETSIPYVNMGNYYMRFGDTLTAINYYETAVVKNAQPGVAKFLSDYFVKHNNTGKAQYYNNKAYEASKRKDN